MLVAAPLPPGSGVAEVDRDAGRRGDLEVAGHFGALVPGEGAAQRHREQAERADDGPMQGWSSPAPAAGEA